ncbi:MAG: CDP-glucose 4,6-dehydratase [Dehalococcoidia bacterium]|nr:CDP-glucose 4,6-dehydratase [Dehalococcoidia bacterium]
MKEPFNNVFKGKAVLVTGHTGFKGSWLSIWLRELGADVIGYALEPYTENDNFVVAKIGSKIKHNIGDITDYSKLKRVFNEYQPEVVFHMAAQSLVRLSYKQPKLTYDTNVMGTVNVLECCRLTDSVKVIINVTSDKCYENKEWIWGYRENDPVGGYDPYSSSKACAEIVTSAYRNSFFNICEPNKSISSVRAGNVIGGGDWREDRLVPDCIRALRNNEPIGIRSPQSIRPWQHVLEPLSGYLLLASKMYEDGEKYSGAWNFGPDHKSIVTVEELVKSLIKHWGHGRYKDLSKGSSGEPHEAKSLILDISKAINLLNWKPTLSVNEAIEYTVNWYKASDVDYDFCVSQIVNYVNRSVEIRGMGRNQK